MADDLVSGQITFSGLGTGMDFAAIIDQLVEVERIHINRLETWKEEWNDKIESAQELNTKLLSLKTSLSGMDTMDEFLVKTVSSSDSTVVTATADSDAQIATHSVTVNQLAQNEILVSSGASFVTDPSTVDITSGAARQFDYTYDGHATVSVSVPSGSTMNDLVSLINSDPDNPGIKAGVLKIADNEYRLQLWGMDLGKDYDITVEVTTTIPDYGNGDFTTSQSAQNSQIRVDGFPPAGWIERETNTIDDVITGITLSLKNTGSATLTVDTDTDAVKDKVREFVNQVNEVRSVIIEMTDFNSYTETGSVMTGNYSVQIIDSRLKSIIADKGLGFDYTNDVISSLASIGILTNAEEGADNEGLLELDEESLDAALSSYPTELAEIFAADYIGDTNSSDFRYYSYIEDVTEAGEYDVSYTVSGGAVASATINGHTASISGTQITGASGYDESGLVIEVENLADGNYTGEVYLKLGKAGELINELKDLTNASSGPLHIIQDSYQDIIDNIDDKIADEEDRIAQMESRLRERFANLEALLGYYDNLSVSLSNQIQQLDNG